MKKIMGKSLVFALASSLSLAAATVPVFATDVSQTGGTGSDSGGSVQANTTINEAATVYSIDVVWDNPTFNYVYTPSSWDPNTLSYGTATHTWQANGGAAGESADAILATVTNKSNHAINIDMAIANTTNSDANLIFTGSFTNNATYLDAATTNTSTSSIYTVNVSGTLPSGTISATGLAIGSATLSVSPANPT